MNAKIEILDWHNQKPPYTVGINKFTYMDVEFDYDGQADPKKYLPFPFDLVTLVLEQREITGWWDNLKWDGYRLTDNDKIFYWKKNKNL